MPSIDQVTCEDIEAEVRSLPKEESNFIEYEITPYTREEIKVECNISNEQFDALLATRFKKMVCPFGVVIAGTSLFPSPNIHYTANVVANLLDPAEKGKIEEGSDKEKL